MSIGRRLGVGVGRIKVVVVRVIGSKCKRSGEGANK
jgi:hypothetical protein